MNDEQIRRIMDESENYDQAREESLRSMFKDFYNKRMLSIVILVWTMGIAFGAGAVVTAVLFFRAGATKQQILYAALFVCFIHLLSILKIFAWQMIHKNSIKREVKRLELAIAQLPEQLKT